MTRVALVASRSARHRVRAQGASPCASRRHCVCARPSSAAADGSISPVSHATSDVASISKLNGVHLTPVLQRVYGNSGGIKRIVGSLDGRGNPLDGLELALDSILRGDSGKVSLARDNNGRALDSPDGWTEQPKAGSTVMLTINNALQDICERELAIAVDSLGAQGGDIVVMNPHTGEILALASNRVGRTTFGEHRGHRAVRARLDAQAIHRRGAARAQTRATRRHRQDPQRQARGRWACHKRHAQGGGALARRRDQVLEQRRDRSVRPAAHAAPEIRDLPRSWLRHAARCPATGRSGRNAARAEAVVAADERVDSDGVRDRSHAVAAGDRVRGDREWWRAARAAHREGSPLGRRAKSSTAPSPRRYGV